MLGITWLLSLPTWGSIWTRLACHLHHPTAYGCQTRGQSPDAAFIYLTTKLLPRALLPMLVHTLPLSSSGIESLDRCRLVQLLRARWCKLQSTFS
jgi:hypothetical protein